MGAPGEPGSLEGLRGFLGDSGRQEQPGGGVAASVLARSRKDQRKAFSIARGAQRWAVGRCLYRGGAPQDDLCGVIRY